MRISHTAWQEKHKQSYVYQNAAFFGTYVRACLSELNGFSMCLTSEVIVKKQDDMACQITPAPTDMMGFVPGLWPAVKGRMP